MRIPFILVEEREDVMSETSCSNEWFNRDSEFPNHLLAG